MPQGRRPMPTMLKIARGNPSRRPLPKGEPQPPPGLPEAPPHLNALAREEWDRIGPILAHLGIVTQADRSVLAGYCAAYARWAMAEDQVQDWTDLLVRGSMGSDLINPCIRIANQSLEIMRGYMVELGLTPSSRTKLAKGEPSVDDPLEQFLKQKKARK